MKIFEDEPEGLAGEAARTRVFLKLTAIYIVVGLILWNITDNRMSVFKMFALLCFLGAFYGAARTIYHATTLGVVHLSDRWKPVLQVVVAVVIAALPFFYFLDGVEVSSEVFKYNFTSWTLWLTTLFIAWVSYKVYIGMGPPLVPVRSFLLAVAVLAFIEFGYAHGAFETSDDEGGYSSSVPLPNPNSVEGKRRMARNYLRMITAAYLGLVAGMLKMNAPKRRATDSTASTASVVIGKSDPPIGM